MLKEMQKMMTPQHRRNWSVELHRKFVAAVNQLGIYKAVPKKILDLMNVEGLTRENVASHLQKYRLYLKKASQQASMVAAMGSSDYYLWIGRISSTTLPSYASSGIFGKLNSLAALNLRGISSYALIRPVQSQNINNSLNTLGNIQPSIVFSLLLLFLCVCLFVFYNF